MLVPTIKSVIKMIMAAAYICALSASRGGADERAGDPLYGGRVNAKALGNAAYTFTGALTLVQGKGSSGRHVTSR